MDQGPPRPPCFPYMQGLNLLDLSKLINNPITQYVACPAMLTKLPSYIPKFEGSVGEDTTNGFMAFHICCSLKNITKDSNHLWLFQRTLMGPATKWYMNDPIRTYTTIEWIDKEFLSFFQLPIHHNTRLELFTKLHQPTSTHIADHIHEWKIWKFMYKINVEPKLLLDWFRKYLIPPISKDVAMGIP